MKELGIIAVYLFGSEAEGTAAWLDTYGSEKEKEPQRASKVVK
ncbi:MAG: hypothetical protein Q8P40_03505 [Nitrospirota bacterium]|nr:hypothetical protein [Nitrospirota bacterium]